MMNFGGFGLDSLSGILGGGNDPKKKKPGALQTSIVPIKQDEGLKSDIKPIGNPSIEKVNSPSLTDQIDAAGGNPRTAFDPLDANKDHKVDWGEKKPDGFLRKAARFNDRLAEASGQEEGKTGFDWDSIMGNKEEEQGGDPTSIVDVSGNRKKNKSALLKSLMGFGGW